MPQNEKHVQPDHSSSPEFIGRKCSSIANSSGSTSYPQLARDRNPERSNQARSFPSSRIHLRKMLSGYTPPFIIRKRKFSRGSRTLAQIHQALSRCPQSPALRLSSQRPNPSPQTCTALAAGAARLGRLLRPKILCRIGTHHDPVRAGSLTARRKPALSQ